MVYVVSGCLIVISCFTGLLAGYSNIAKECRLLGSFYVGDTVYECRVKEKA